MKEFVNGGREAMKRVKRIMEGVREAGLAESILAPEKSCPSMEEWEAGGQRSLKIQREIEARLDTLNREETRFFHMYGRVCGVRVGAFWGGKDGAIGFGLDPNLFRIELIEGKFNREETESIPQLLASPYYDSSLGYYDGFPFDLALDEEFLDLGVYPCPDRTDPREAADQYFKILDKVLEVVCKELREFVDNQKKA